MSIEPKDSLSDAEMDALFSAARAEGASDQTDILPSADFFATILNDAEAHQPEGIPVPARAAPPVAAPSILAQLRDALGGWAGLGGLVAASLTGIMIGVSPPAAVTDVTALLSGTAEFTGAASGFDALLSDEG